MHDDERRAIGEKMRRTILGDTHVDRALASRTPLTAEFQDFITRYVWGEIWTRDGLDARTRRVLLLGTLIALGRWDELAMHVRAALGAGALAPEEIKEIVLQQAAYCGVPAANHALAILQETMNARAIYEASAAADPAARKATPRKPSRSRAARDRPVR